MTILPVHLPVTLLPKRFCQALLAAAMLASPRASLADVLLPHVFSDNMVLQQQEPVPVWGTAAPGERVSMEFAGQKKAAVTDASGHWRVTLDPLQASQVPRTGMVVTTDITDNVHDHHPRDKKSVGERLALWALAKNYGRAELVCSGPLFKKMDVSGNRALISFEYVDGGLMSRDGKPLSWFTIAGKDGKFLPATATVEGTQVAVSNPEVSAPVAVRFDWDELAMPNLCNKVGLPASPFRTDFVPWHIPGR